MAKTKEELKAMFSDGKKPSGDDFAELIDGVEGPKGEPGTDGKDGSNGADGFGTEEQYDDIIERLDAIDAKLDESDTE